MIYNDFDIINYQKPKISNFIESLWYKVYILVSFIFLNVKTILKLNTIFQVQGYIWKELYIMAVRTLPIILVTSIFIGGVTAWSAAFQFSDYIPLNYLGVAVGKSVATELAPVLTALVFAGRIGSAIAGEIGTMKVGEQIDAMKVLNLDIIKYLVIPKVVAASIALPVLTIFSDVFSVLGAWLVAKFLVNLETIIFFRGLKLFLNTFDVYFGIGKAFIFGYIIAIVASFYGFKTEGGAVGVGNTTKDSVITVSVLILITDAIIWILMK